MKTHFPAPPLDPLWEMKKHRAPKETYYPGVSYKKTWGEGGGNSVGAWTRKGTFFRRHRNIKIHAFSNIEHCGRVCVGSAYRSFVARVVVEGFCAPVSGIQHKCITNAMQF